jgi:ribosomal protein S27E
MPRGSRSKGPRIPSSVECAGCGRTLSTATYSPIGWAGPDVPPERIHKIRHPLYATFGVVCPNCGHYTIYETGDPLRGQSSEQ